MYELQSEQIDQLIKKIHAVHKNHGTVLSKDAKSNRNTYASLAGILSQIQGFISPYGLVLTHGTCSINQKEGIYTLLEDIESGQWRRIESILTHKTIPILPEHITQRMSQPEWESYIKALINYKEDQEWGSSTTYHRRYPSMMILGLFAADDPSEFNEGHQDIISESPINNDNISEGQRKFFFVKSKDKPEKKDAIFKKLGIDNDSQIPKSKFQQIIDYLES